MRSDKGYSRLNVQADFFYADDRMVASTYPGWLHTAFNTLAGIFDRVGLLTNVRKTVGMVCQPYRVVWV